MCGFVGGDIWLLRLGGVGVWGRDDLIVYGLWLIVYDPWFMDYDLGLMGYELLLKS